MTTPDQTVIPATEALDLVLELYYTGEADTLADAEQLAAELLPGLLDYADGWDKGAANA